MEKDEKIKTTLRLYKWLWQAVQHKAIQEDTSAESIVIQALVEYLDIKPGEIDVVVTYARRKKGVKS